MVVVVYVTPDGEIDAFGPFKDFDEADAWIEIKQDAGWQGRFMARYLRNIGYG